LNLDSHQIVRLGKSPCQEDLSEGPLAKSFEELKVAGDTLLNDKTAEVGDPFRKILLFLS
jgi:hypothetical protein